MQGRATRPLDGGPRRGLVRGLGGRCRMVPWCRHRCSFVQPYAGPCKAANASSRHRSASVRSSNPRVAGSSPAGRARGYGLTVRSTVGSSYYAGLPRLTHFALVCSTLLTPCLPKNRRQDGGKPCHRHDPRSCGGQEGHLGAKPGTWTGERLADRWEVGTAMRGSSRTVAAAVLLRTLPGGSQAG